MHKYWENFVADGVLITEHLPEICIDWILTRIDDTISITEQPYVLFYVIVYPAYHISIIAKHFIISSAKGSLFRHMEFCF